MERLSLNSVDSALLDLEVWPGINEDLINDPVLQDTVERRCRTIRLFVDRVPGDRIALETGISGRMALYWLQRCLKIHPDGRIYGFRALLPYTHIKPYRRVAEMTRTVRSTPGGASGAFGQLLRSHPELKDLLDRHILRHKQNKAIYESRLRLKSLHKRFLDRCRELGLDVGKQYPFNTTKLASQSLWRYVHDTILENAAKAIPAVYGSDAAKILQTGDGSNRPILKPFERVECDAHHIDAIFALSIRSVFGNEVRKTLPRLWVLAIEEPLSTAILGYHRSARDEPNSDDVLETIKSALQPWRPRELRIPRLQYNKGAGLPSSYNARFIGACWKEFSVDEAMANTAGRVKKKIEALMGAKVTTLARHNPNDRPFIERFFGMLEENGFHRLPNTTGSSPKDSRRKSPDRAALKFNMEVEHLDELLDVIIANYNATPKTSLGGRTPLEYLEYLCDHHQCWPSQADQHEVDRLLAVRRTVIVRGDAAHGRRPHINFSGVRYTSEVLRNAFHLTGTKITIEISQDIRTVRAYSESGADLGPLLAASPWQRTPHTLETRRAIQSQINKRMLHYVEGHDPVMDYMDYLEEQIRTGKSVPPLYLELRQMLTDHWQDSDVSGSMEALSRARPSGAGSIKDRTVSSTSAWAPEGHDNRPRPPRMAING